MIGIPIGLVQGGCKILNQYKPGRYALFIKILFWGNYPYLVLEAPFGNYLVLKKGPISLYWRAHGFATLTTKPSNTRRSTLLWSITFSPCYGLQYKVFSFPVIYIG